MVMEDDITRKRNEIDQVDQELVVLLNRRASIALEIGALKSRTGSKVYDPARERIILEKLEKLNQGPLGKGALEEVFTSIIAACRELQSK
jgi:chorismate mutase / prephenate dehydratase